LEGNYLVLQAASTDYDNLIGEKANCLSLDGETEVETSFVNWWAMLSQQKKTQ